MPIGSPTSFRRSIVARSVVLLGIGLATTACAPIRGQDASANTAIAAVKQFAAGRGDSFVLDLARLTPAQRQNVLKLPLTERISLGDVATEETSAAGPVVIKRPIVSTLDKIVAAITAAYPTARLSISNGWRPAAADRQVGGTGSGPHVRGDSIDIAFDIPGLNSRAAAVRVASEANKLGAKGIAILNDVARYQVHIDPVRSDPWYVEQVWQEIDTPAGQKWVTFYQGVDPKLWAMPAASPEGADAIAGDWMATSILSGKDVVNGSVKSAPMRVTVYRKPNGHYGMRIPGDTIPEVTALWDAVRRGPGSYVVRYRWPRKPPDKGIEEFTGIVEVKNGVAIRNTDQTNPAYPGQSTHVNARWVRIAAARRGIDPELTYHDNMLWSHGRKCTGADETARGGQYIDSQLFDARTYRESAPVFDAAFQSRKSAGAPVK